MTSLAGKNVVFVGGLGGIGLETSKQLMTKNLAALVILELLENPKAVQELQAINPKTKVKYIKFDITDKEVVKRAFSEAVAELEYIDVLINGAGLIADRNIELTFNVNIIGMIYSTFEALPYMDKTRNGRGGLIANIVSVVGLEPLGALSVYSSSKFAAMGFTRSLADPAYYERTGVAVMAFCPGVTDTPLWKDHVRGRDTFDYSKPLTENLLKCKTQAPDVCGAHFVEAIEKTENGGIWISDLGTLRPVNPTTYWQLTF